MSVSMWAYDPDICDGDFCPMNCDFCSKAYDREEAEPYDYDPGDDYRSLADGN